MTVSRITKDEINSERAAYIQEFRNPKPVKTEKKPVQTKCYIDMVSDKKISEFFAPYGYITHERVVADKQLGNCIYVHLNDFDIMFNDFTTVACSVQNPEGYELPMLFNFDSFAFNCEKLGVTPGFAFGEQISESLFNNLPYYAENKAKFMETNTENVPPEFKNLLKSVGESLKYMANRSLVIKKYGSTDPEKISETIVRANTK